MAKILLVEDDNNLREIYGERLLAEGYEIVAARDGEEALSVAITEKPDLIISDVMMPKISGFDMLDILRQTPETKDVKIIMMTALSQAEDKARADMLGANKYLVKSQVTLEDVARVVHDILEEPKPEQEKTDSQDQTITKPTIQPVVAAPANDDLSSVSQQGDDSTKDVTSTNTDDTAQTTVTNDQPEPTNDNNTPTEENIINETNNNNVQEQPIPNQLQSDDELQQVNNQPEQPTETTNQPEQPAEPEQPLETLFPTTQLNQDQQLDSLEQPVAPAESQESTQQATEDLPQPKTDQEPTLQDEQPQEANIEPQALPANPIAQNITQMPMQEQTVTPSEQPKSNSADAEPAADELKEVTNQIEDFIKNSVTPLSDHQEPLTQPSSANTDTENDNNEQTSEPQAEQPTEQTAPENGVEAAQYQDTAEQQSTTQQTTENSEPTSEIIDATSPDQNADQPQQADTPESPQDNTIPPVIPLEPSDDDTRNPEPASVRKKIISPMHGDGDLGTPDINKLYQEELAKEAEENGFQNPVANSIVSASTNPISVGSSDGELPQLETIDASQIPGISTDGTAPIGVVTPTTTPEQPTQTDNTTPEPHEDPNNPNNIAL